MGIQEQLRQLNNEQREAALNIYGPSMVIAGPGSGKTKTLVTRTANMVANGVPAHQIVLFTFTKKAANEIKERVVSAVGEKAELITVGTYHSVCCRLLRKYSAYVGLTSNYSILDTDDVKKIIKQILKATNYNYEVDDVLSKISSYKCKLIHTSDAIRQATNTMEMEYAQLYQLYENKLTVLNSVDFDNLIFKMVRILENYPNVKQEINNRYQYIVAKLIGTYYGDVV